MDYRSVDIQDLRNRTTAPEDDGAIAKGGESFAELFESFEANQNFRIGDIVTGRVISITKDYVVVDIGYKSEGQIPIAEFRDAAGGVTIGEGDSVEVYVDQADEDDDALVELSKDKAEKLRIWDQISVACENDELVRGRIIMRVKGGLSVDIGVKAFLPGSQVDIRPIRNLEKFLSEEFDFKVIKFNKRRGNIVLSRRVLLEKERASLKSKTLEQLEEGAVMKGTVKNITEYGAFVDLGGIDGLLHITDMSWGRVNHPSEKVQVGDEIDDVRRAGGRSRRRKEAIVAIGRARFARAVERWIAVGGRVEVSGIDDAGTAGAVQDDLHFGARQHEARLGGREREEAARRDGGAVGDGVSRRQGRLVAEVEAGEVDGLPERRVEELDPAAIGGAGAAEPFVDDDGDRSAGLLWTLADDARDEAEVARRHGRVVNGDGDRVRADDEPLEGHVELFEAVGLV